MKKSKVTLRKRTIENGRRKSFYLDFYPPIVHPKTRKDTRRLALGIYLYSKPEGTKQKDANEQSRQDARDKAAEVQMMLSSGDLTFLGGVANDTGFVQYCRNKLQERVVDRNLKERTVKSNTTAINWLEKCVGEIPFENVDHEMVLDFRKYLRDEGKSQSSIKTYESYIVSFIDWAYNEDKMPPLKRKLIPGFRGKGKATRRLTASEVDRLIATATKPPVVRRAGLFCLSTALRIGDVLKLTYSDLKHEGDRSYLDIVLEKTGTPLRVHLNDEALYLFGNKGQERVFPISYINFWRGLKIWAKDAGITWADKLGSHSFRATALDAHANREGVGLDVAQQVAAHSTIATTQIYAGTDQKRIQDAVDQHTFGIIEKLGGV